MTYHHYDACDHRRKAAMRTAHKVGDAFEVSGSSRLDWFKTAGTFLCVASAAFVVGMFLVLAKGCA